MKFIATRHDLLDSMLGGLRVMRFHACPANCDTGLWKVVEADGVHNVRRCNGCSATMHRISTLVPQHNARVLGYRGQ
jgi:hypothetical protein